MKETVQRLEAELDHWRSGNTLSSQKHSSFQALCDHFRILEHAFIIIH